MHVDKGVSAAPSGTKAVPRVTKPVSMATTSTAGNTYHMKLVVCMCVIMYVCTLIISVSGVSAAPSGTKASLYGNDEHSR